MEQLRHADRGRRDGGPVPPIVGECCAWSGWIRRCRAVTGSRRWSGLAGGESGPIAAGEPSRKMAWQELRAVEPEVIVMMPCGFGPERAAQESEVLWRLDGWTRIAGRAKGRGVRPRRKRLLQPPGTAAWWMGSRRSRTSSTRTWSRRRRRSGSVLKLVSPPAGGSSVENWAPRFEPLIGVAL